MGRGASETRLCLGGYKGILKNSPRWPSLSKSNDDLPKEPATLGARGDNAYSLLSIDTIEEKIHSAILTSKSSRSSFAQRSDWVERLLPRVSKTYLGGPLPLIPQWLKMSASVYILLN